MPKDNEVDEKVIEPVAVIYPDTGLRNDAAAMALWRNHGYDTGGEPLYSAATVAELRAEVDRLDACIDAIHENWMNYGPHREIVARADAAERRAGELEAALKPLADACYAEFCSVVTENLEPNIAKVSYPEDDCNITFGMIRNARKALTGADPT